MDTSTVPTVKTRVDTFISIVSVDHYVCTSQPVSVSYAQNLVTYNNLLNDFVSISSGDQVLYARAVDEYLDFVCDYLSAATKMYGSSAAYQDIHYDVRNDLSNIY